MDDKVLYWMYLILLSLYNFSCGTSLFVVFLFCIKIVCVFLINISIFLSVDLVIVINVALSLLVWWVIYLLCLIGIKLLENGSNPCCQPVIYVFEVACCSFYVLYLGINFDDWMCIVFYVFFCALLLVLL